MYETGIYRRAGHLAQKHTFSRVFGYFSREDDFLTSSAQFFQRFFTEKPTCLHKIAGKPHGYRVSCSFKPTRCLHDAYISLHWEREPRRPIGVLAETIWPVCKTYAY